MSRAPLPISEVVRRLEALHGVPEDPPTSEAFELVLWENVAYLASPAWR